MRTGQTYGSYPNYPSSTEGSGSQRSEQIGTDSFSDNASTRSGDTSYTSTFTSEVGSTSGSTGAQTSSHSREKSNMHSGITHKTDSSESNMYQSWESSSYSAEVYTDVSEYRTLWTDYEESRIL